VQRVPGRVWKSDCGDVFGVRMFCAPGCGFCLKRVKALSLNGSRQYGMMRTIISCQTCSHALLTPCFGFAVSDLNSQKYSHTATSAARAKMSSGKHNCYNQRTQESQRRDLWLYWTGRLSVLHDESPRPTNARVWMDGKWSRNSSLLGSISLA
jgi:hypothetical protein